MNSGLIERGNWPVIRESWRFRCGCLLFRWRLRVEAGFRRAVSRLRSRPRRTCFGAGRLSGPVAGGLGGCLRYFRR